MACPKVTANGDQFCHTVPPGPSWVRQLHQMSQRIAPSSRSKAARGPSRSLGPTLWSHARLSWRALQF
eukprot:6095255-Pleurochrysis_carterae.AAC.1